MTKTKKENKEREVEMWNEKGEKKKAADDNDDYGVQPVRQCSKDTGKRDYTQVGGSC